MEISESRQRDLVRILKRCSPETLAAALRFEKTQNPADVSTVVFGVIARDLPEEAQCDLSTAPGTSRIIEDLGMDSLCLMEVVLAIEEIFNISIENQELKEIATLDNLNGFIRAKLGVAH